MKNIKQIIDEEKKKIKEEYADMLLEVELPMEYQLTKYIEERLYYLITQLLEELREEEWTSDGRTNDGFSIYDKVKEHNRTIRTLNYKIDKILNK